MNRIRLTVRHLVMYVATLVLATGYPIAVMASAQEPTTTGVNIVPVEASGGAAPVTPSSPEGAAEKPVESPVKKAAPKYTYNPETKTWDSSAWVFNPATNKYERPPAPIIIEPQAETTINSDTKVNINNTVNSEAISGDSTVGSNTKAGNATTGDASAVATLVNNVNSTMAIGGNEKVAQFTKDIVGDVKGDIILYPMLLKAMLESKVQPNDSNTVNVNNSLNVNNNVSLLAQSGDAAVSNNTQAGDATSGSAHAVANVVNILNSMISTQRSFIGTVNIYGNLEGDILIAPDFIPQMLSNNGVKDSDTKVSSQDTQAIVNSISAVAESGAASVFGNTAGGDARSGSADSNVVIFNVSGHDIVASNSLLVFVNVLGKWVGVIVDAPAGANAAMLGSGVSSHKYAPDLSVTTANYHGITNNIEVMALSGDAKVSGNTVAGNAVTGSAMAAVNVANVSGSQMALTDWFGVLFINVFQNWYGSFGVDTPYGNSPPTNRAEPARPTGPIQFIPSRAASNSKQSNQIVYDIRNVNSDGFKVAPVYTQEAGLAYAGPSYQGSAEALGESSDKNNLQSSADYRLWVIAGSMMVVGLSAIGLRRLFGYK